MKCHRVFGGLVTRRLRSFSPPPRLGHRPPGAPVPGHPLPVPRYPVTLQRDPHGPVSPGTRSLTPGTTGACLAMVKCYGELIPITA